MPSSSVPGGSERDILKEPAQAACAFQKLGSELLGPARRTDEHLVILPLYESNFQEQFREVVDTLDWVEIDQISHWLIQQFNKGHKSNLLRRTSYVNFYEQCVDHFQRKRSVCLIKELLNTPRSKDMNVAFIQQCVTVAAIARGLCCVLNKDTLPQVPVAVSDINKVVGASDHVNMKWRLPRLPVPVENDMSRHIDMTIRILMGRHTRSC